MGSSIEQAPGDSPNNEIMTNKCVVLGRCGRDLCVVLTCNYVTISGIFRN
jgi:hypothetical protein